MFLLMLLFACSQDDELNELDQPAVDLEVRYEVVPAKLEFGDCDIDAPCQEVITVHNRGQDDIVIVDVVPPDDFPVAIAAPNVPFVSPGRSSDILVTWTPDTTAALGGKVAVVIAGSDDQPEEVRVRLSGAGQGPVLTVSSRHYDFGEVGVGCKGTATITVANTGNEPVEVQRLRIEGLQFTLRPLTTSLPAQIEPFQSLNLEVVFEPRSDKITTGAIEIVSDMGLQTSTLEGRGKVDGEENLTFKVEEQKRMTALFHVNAVAVPGGPWSPYATHLEDSLPAFFQTLQDNYTQYRVAFLWQTNGKVTGGTDYIDQTLSPADATDEAVSMLYGGGGGDNDSTYTTFLNGIAENKDWLFEDATWELSKLNLIAVNRDTEQSGGSWAAHVASAQAYKDDSDDVVFHAIAGMSPTTCSLVEPFSGYHDAVATTGGVFNDMCDADWTSGMQKIAAASMSGSSIFALRGTPIVDTIEVRVDSELVSYWNYDADLNGVVFYEDSFPAQTATVDIHYLMSDGC